MRPSPDEMADARRSAGTSSQSRSESRRHSTPHAPRESVGVGSSMWGSLLGYWRRPEEMVNVAVFMASDHARGIAGTTLNLTMGNLDD
jgi:hypothetical protein